MRNYLIAVIPAATIALLSLLFGLLLEHAYSMILILEQVTRLVFPAVLLVLFRYHPVYRRRFTLFLFVQLGFLVVYVFVTVILTNMYTMYFYYAGESLVNLIRFVYYLPLVATFVFMSIMLKDMFDNYNQTSSYLIIAAIVVLIASSLFYANGMTILITVVESDPWVVATMVLIGFGFSLHSSLFTLAILLENE